MFLFYQIYSIVVISPDAFLSYILEDLAKIPYKGDVNYHWRPQHGSCPFCRFNFTVYSKMEEMDQDTAYILLKTNLADVSMTENEEKLEILTLKKWLILGTFSFFLKEISSRTPRTIQPLWWRKGEWGQKIQWVLVERRLRSGPAGVPGVQTGFRNV